MKQQAEEQTVIGQRLKQPGQEPEPAQRRKMLQQSRPSFKTQGLPSETRQWAKLNLMVDRMFDKIDTDGSGDISIDELREDMRRRFPNISEEQIQQFFDDMDVNHDGKEHLYAVELSPHSPLRAVRIDPSRGVGKIKIKKLYLSDSQGRPLYEWKFDPSVP